MPRKKKPELNNREKSILRFIEKQIMTQGSVSYTHLGFYR